MEYEKIITNFPGGGQNHENDSGLEKDELDADLFNEYERVMQKLVDNSQVSYTPHGYWGLSTLNSTTGRTIKHFKNLSYYSVEVIVLGNSTSVGNITVDTSDPNQFTVYNSGTDNTSNFIWIIKELPRFTGYYVVSSAFSNPKINLIHDYPLDSVHISSFIPKQQPNNSLQDKYVIPHQIYDELKVTGSFDNQPIDIFFTGLGKDEASGTNNFNSTTGVTISHSLGTSDLDILIVPIEDPSPDTIGDIWVEITNTDFTVYNSGSATTQFFWVILSTNPDDYFMRGNSTFNPGAGNGVTINHNIGHLNYFVIVIPTQDTGGNLGDVWIEKTETDVIIKNNGTANTSFNYRIVLPDEV